MTYERGVGCIGIVLRFLIVHSFVSQPSDIIHKI